MRTHIMIRCSRINDSFDATYHNRTRHNIHICLMFHSKVVLVVTKTFSVEKFNIFIKWSTCSVMSFRFVTTLDETDCCCKRSSGSAIDFVEHLFEIFPDRMSSWIFPNRMTASCGHSERSRGRGIDDKGLTNTMFSINSIL